MEPRRRYTPFRHECLSCCTLHQSGLFALSLPRCYLPAPIDTLYGKNIGTRHSARNMALGKFCILFTFGKVKVIGGNMEWYRTKIYRTMTPIDIRPSIGQPMCYTQTARISVQNFAAVRCAVSEEIADRQPSIII